jgi:hypothetical protein
MRAEFVSDKMSYVMLTRLLVLYHCSEFHASTEDKNDDVKDRF